MRNRGRVVIVLLIVLISATTLALGSMMYHSNLKKTKQNIIGVELADFIFNINYSVQFGKQIETFFGMADLLQSEKALFPDVQELYVVSEDGDVLFATTDQQPEQKALLLAAGENINTRESMFCMYALSGQARILVRTDRASVDAQMLQYLKTTSLKAAIGVACTILCVLLFARLQKKEKTGSVICAGLLIVWTIVFGAMIGTDGYRAYRDSFESLCDTIRISIRSDFDKMEGFGVPEDELCDVDGYLKRYTDLIPEIESIEIENDNIRCVRSPEYGRRMLTDYSLQTVLLLTFSILIFTEYRLYSKNDAAAKKEEPYGTK